MSAGTPKKLKMETNENIHIINKYPMLPIPERGIDQATAELYGIRTKVNGDGSNAPLAHYFPYYNDKGKLTGYKKRNLLVSKKESFSAIGDVTETSMPYGYPTLGKDKWKLIICEGEYDAALLHRAIAAYHRKKGQEDKGIHVVSIATGAPNAESYLLNHVELLKQYKEIILVFDNDKATPDEKLKGVVRGQDAVENVCLALHDYPIKYAKLSCKDPCEMFANKRLTEMVQEVLFNSLEFKPEVLTTFEGTDEEIDDLLVALPKGIRIPFLPELSACMHGMRKHEMTVLLAPTGCGKCLGKGTEVVMYDGSLEKVENIKVGDKLMGPDSRPRTVSSVTTGTEQMYWIHQNKGINYKVNESHILSLKWTLTEGKMKKKGEIENISVKDYLSLSKTQKHCLKGWSTGVDFEYSCPVWEPYMIGLWLADGSSQSPIITFNNKDIPLYKELYSFVNRNNYNVNISPSHLKNTKRCDDIYISGGFVTKLKKLNLFKNKHIPKTYLTSSRKERLEILAGILDGDGYYSNGRFDIILKSPVFAEDLTFLARSLGFKVCSSVQLKSCQSFDEPREYTRLTISGHLDVIPTRLKRKQALKRKINKDPNVTGIKVVKDKIDTYYGFTLKEDPLFLLKDFTVTHNTTISKQLGYEMVKHHGWKIANFFLEEPLRIAKQSYVSLYNNVRPAKFYEDPSIIPRDKVVEARDWMLENMIFYDCDKASILKPENVVRMVKHCAVKGYDAIIFDHLSFVLSGDDSGNERKVLDKLLTELSLVARGYPVHIWVVAHIKRSTTFRPPKDPETHEVIYPHWFPVKKEDGRSSGAFEQLAHNIICLEPEILDEDGTKGNVRLVQRKNRIWGEERVCDVLSYDTVRGVLG